MTRSRILAVFTLVTVVLGYAGIAGALDGDPPGQVGWWTSEPGASAQPAGGFQVGSLGGQAVSVAAVQFSTPSGVTSARLTLHEASGGFVTPTSALQVCATTATWKAANPGAMADAPKADCAQKVDLARDANKLVWTAEVAALMPTLGGERSLMIVPGAPAGGSPTDPGFRVKFSSAALAVVSTPETTTSPTTAYSAGSGYDSGNTSTYDPGTSSGSISGLGDLTPTTVAATTQTAATIPQTEAFQPPPLAAGATPGTGGGGRGATQPWDRLLFLLPLSAAIGAGNVFVRRALAQRGVVEL